MLGRQVVPSVGCMSLRGRQRACSHQAKTRSVFMSTEKIKCGFPECVING